MGTTGSPEVIDKRRTSSASCTGESATPTTSPPGGSARCWPPRVPQSSSRASPISSSATDASGRASPSRAAVLPTLRRPERRAATGGTRARRRPPPQGRRSRRARWVTSCAHRGTRQPLGPKGPSLLTQSGKAPLMLPTALRTRAVTGHIYRFPATRRTGSGMLANTHAVAPRLAMLTPATWSAGPARPHRRQWK
jgi:hypothetical protein